MVNKISIFCVLLGLASTTLGASPLTSLQRRISVSPRKQAILIRTANTQPEKHHQPRPRKARGHRPNPPVPSLQPLSTHRPFPQRHTLRAAQFRHLQPTLLVRCHLLQARRARHRATVRRDIRRRSPWVPTEGSAAPTRRGDEGHRCRARASLLRHQHPDGEFLD